MTAQVISIAQPRETLRVNALHALAYCPRLFYLEEVEELYTQDEAVFAGRRLHTELERNEDGTWETLTLEDAALGLRGKVDALRMRNGQTIPYEHKRGRCYRDAQNQPQTWESDRLQVLAYACLIEAVLGIVVHEGRVRYHADNVVVKVPVTDIGRQQVQLAIEQAYTLRQTTERPPIATNERLCARCSLAPVCLPEETRFAKNPHHQPVRLFPEDDDREILHILEPGTRIGKSGEQIKITKLDGTVNALPARQVGQLVLHGSGVQISTQTLHFCAEQEMGVHFLSGSGKYIGSFDTRQGSIQRRIRQYKALTQPELCLHLAQQLVVCRGQSQRKFLMRGLRNWETSTENLEAAGVETLRSAIDQIQKVLKQVELAPSLATLLGYEGNIAKLYFAALPELLSAHAIEDFQFCDRNRQPPKDRFNCLLSTGYSLLLKDVMNAILTVGLEPILGFYHQPRTQAPPLALDLMEIFRVPLVDMIVMSSINKKQWHPIDDFDIKGQQVFLSRTGWRKFIQLYERRKEETWKHPLLGYSLTYRRLIELEVRLLEKEWMDEGGLFAQLILR